jgi:hypothetical protein
MPTLKMVVNMKLVLGLYLNEENGQTFEIVDYKYGSVFLHVPYFFDNAVVHVYESLDALLDLMFEGKITYIGEV